MPTYEYKCEKGHEFEVFQRMTEPPVEKCIHCGARAERLLSKGGGVIFKGSGFYSTDYRSDTYKKAAEADKGGSADSKSADSKPGPKPADTPKPSGSSPGSSGSE